MPQGFTHDDIVMMDEIARQTFQGKSLFQQQFGEQRMTSYEKQTIKNFMDIQYGSGASIEHLTMAYGYFGTIIKFIEEAGYEVPAELISNRDASKRDLDFKLKEARKSEIAKIKTELDGLQSAEEKRTKLNERLAKLEALNN